MMRCPACHASNPPENQHCQQCGEKLSLSPQASSAEEVLDVLPVPGPSGGETGPARAHPEGAEDEEEEADVVSTLIPYLNPRALAAYYCGFFALIPGLGFILGAVAIVLGVGGLRYASANPKARGAAHAITGIILGAVAVFCWNPLVCLLLWFTYWQLP